MLFCALNYAAAFITLIIIKPGHSIPYKITSALIKLIAARPEMLWILGYPRSSQRIRIRRLISLRWAHMQSCRNYHMCWLICSTATQVLLDFTWRGLWPCKIDLSPPVKQFTDRSKAVLLLWFIISVIVCLCMYALMKFLFWIALWPMFGKETVLLAFYL